MSFDPETVDFLPSYSVGMLPPPDGSLRPGMLHLELAPTPRLWVGTLKDLGFEGNVTVLVATPPLMAPINRAVPYVSQYGDTLTCTMGTWTGEPTAYSYEWTLDGTPAGDDSDTLIVTAAEVGQVAVCVVTATNDTGTTEAPPSNEVTVAEIAVTQEETI
jgi:hypothetical protein